MLSIGSITSALRSISNMVGYAFPVAKVLGVNDKFIDIVKTATEIAENISNRVDEGKIVVASHDAEELKRIIAELQKANDTLAEQIDES